MMPDLLQSRSVSGKKMILKTDGEVGGGGGRRGSESRWWRRREDDVVDAEEKVRLDDMMQALCWDVLKD